MSTAPGDPAAAAAAAAHVVSAPGELVRRAVADASRLGPAQQPLAVARACVAGLTSRVWEDHQVEELLALLRTEMGEEPARECAEQVSRELRAYSEAAQATLPLLAAVAAARPPPPTAD